MSKIGDSYLKANHKPGEVLESDYVNECESVIKEAINDNADDIGINKQSIDNINTHVGEIDLTIEGIQGDIRGLDTKIDNNYDTLDRKIDNTAGALDDKIDRVKNNLDANIDKILDGTTPPANSLLLDGAGLHESTDGDLYSTDAKVPTDKVVKDYVDPKFTARPTTDTVNSMIAQAIEGLGRVYIRKVDVLPATGEEGTLYLVPSSDPSTSNLFDEYLYVDDAWEKVGQTEIDLSDYYTKSETYSQSEVDTLLGNKANVSALDNYLAKDNTTAFVPSGNYNPATKKYVDDISATKITQYSTMPTASVDLLGEVVQYAGATDSNYTTGYFYQCVSDGQDPATYSWEELLGSVDLSNYLAKDNATSFTPSGDYNPATKKYVDDNLPDLSNYYTKSQTEGKIDDKIAAIPINDLSHYKGHVNSASSLPTPGQPSGSAGLIDAVIGTNKYSTFIKGLDTSLFSGFYNQISYKNYFLTLTGIHNSSGSGFYGVCGGLMFATDYPEMIEITGTNPYDTNYTEKAYHIPAVLVKYAANKPVYFRWYKSGNDTYSEFSELAWPIMKKRSATGAVVLANTSGVNTQNTWYQVDEDTLFMPTTGLRKNGVTRLYATYQDSQMKTCEIAHNLPNLKVATPDSDFNYADISYNYSGFSGAGYNYKMIDSISTPDNSYHWEDGMIFSTCADGDYTHSDYKTTASEVQDGDLYTVGENYEIYRGYNGLWETWGITEDTVDTKIATAITDALQGYY